MGHSYTPGLNRFLRFGSFVTLTSQQYRRSGCEQPGREEGVSVMIVVCVAAYTHVFIKSDFWMVNYLQWSLLHFHEGPRKRE